MMIKLSFMRANAVSMPRCPAAAAQGRPVTPQAHPRAQDSCSDHHNASDERSSMEGPRDAAEAMSAMQAIRTISGEPKPPEVETKPQTQ